MSPLWRTFTQLLSLTRLACLFALHVSLFFFYYLQLGQNAFRPTFLLILRLFSRSLRLIAKAFVDVAATFFKHH